MTEPKTQDPDAEPQAADAEPQARAVERLTLFSDAVVAIAITLLALELPVPAGSTATALWKSVQHESGHYWAFLLSFFVIANAWYNHHDVFRYTRRLDTTLRSYNMAWLLWIVVTPFAAKLLTAASHPAPDLEAHALRFGFYSLVQVLEAATLLAMLLHDGPAGRGLGAPRRLVAGLMRQSYLMIVSFGLSIPLFFATSDGWVLWIAFPVLSRILLRWHRNRPAPADKPAA